jgi:putative Mn2+ efflux pump MntP
MDPEIKFYKLKKFVKNNLRYIAGALIILLGLVFMMIPFIPLGYILLAVGAFLYTPLIPPLKKFVKFLEKKDDSNKVEKAEEKVDEFFKDKEI